MVMMKPGRLKKYTLIALLIFLSLLSVYLAFLTYRYYGVVARGIVLMYSLIFSGRYSNMDVTIDTLLLDPRKGKYIISALIVPLISYWATAQIYEMVLFFWAEINF